MSSTSQERIRELEERIRTLGWDSEGQIGEKTKAYGLVAIAYAISELADAIRQEAYWHDG